MIPGVIHRYWSGPYPAYLEGIAASWGLLYPDWPVVDWSPENLPTLRNQALYDRAEALAPAGVEQFRADLVRLEVLYDHGGVWVDHDLEALRRVDPLLEGARGALAYEFGTWLGNSFLAFEAGHEWLAELIAGVEASIEAFPGARPNVTTGPQYLTRAYRARRPKPEVRVLRANLFYPYRYDELDRGSQKWPEAYAAHHWNNQRRRRGIPLDSPTSTD